MGCKPNLVNYIWSYLGGGCSLQFSLFYLTHVFLSLLLETKHAAATKSLPFYPVAWPMDIHITCTCNYISTCTPILMTPFQLLYAHMQDVMWAVVIDFITLACVFVCVCVHVCVCVCVYVCKRERECV